MPSIEDLIKYLEMFLRHLKGEVSTLEKILELLKRERDATK